MKKEQLVQLAKNLGINVHNEMSATEIEVELMAFGTVFAHSSKQDNIMDSEEVDLQEENESLKAQLDSLRYSSNQELLDKTEECEQLRAEVERLIKQLDEYNPKTMFAKLLGVRMESELSEAVEVRRDNKRFHLSFNKEFYSAKKKECYEWLGNLKKRADTREEVESSNLSGQGLVVIAK